jgi:hypothetical protein
MARNIIRAVRGFVVITRIDLSRARSSCLSEWSSLTFLVSHLISRAKMERDQRARRSRQAGTEGGQVV